MFKTIHTAYGLAAMAQAEATGTAINITHMAVGDGNGNAVTPAEGQTHLVRERFRATVNRVYQEVDNPNRFTAEMIIPATEGGFVLREVGVFDSTGSLFVVGNLPDTYKPVATEGAFSDTVVRVEFAVTNADVVNIIIDGNVAVATQAWVLNNVTACSLFPGGTTGQILRKRTNACGDTEWADLGDFNVVVDLIEERQTLAAAQTTVTWSQVTTNGLSIYVEGVRIPKGAGADGWLEDPANPNTSIILGKSFPAGTRIVGVQNEPMGSVAVPLYRDNNLSDLENVQTARNNMDVFNRAETREMAPPSKVAYFARSTAPAGWLKANGAAVSRTAYADLFAAIGTTFGAGDGFNTFNLPDLRGEFIRGWDDGRLVDANRAFGSFQGDAIRNITASVDLATAVVDAVGAFRSGTAATAGIAFGTYPDKILFDASRVVPTANENRPRNRALLACIKY